MRGERKVRVSRLLSQVVVALILVAVAVATGMLLARVMHGSIEEYRPSQALVARVGGLELNLKDASSAGYTLALEVKIANMGTITYNVPSGDMYILVEGTTGISRVYACVLTSSAILPPGEIVPLTSECFISSTMLQELFGTPTPPVDLLRSHTQFLYIKLRLLASTGGGWVCITPDCDVYIT